MKSGVGWKRVGKRLRCFAFDLGHRRWSRCRDWRCYGRRHVGRRWCRFTYGRADGSIERHRRLHCWRCGRCGLCGYAVAIAVYTFATTFTAIRTLPTISATVTVTTTRATFTTRWTISTLLRLHDGGHCFSGCCCGCNFACWQLSYRRRVGLTRRTITAFTTRATLTTFTAIRAWFARFTRLALRFGGIGTCHCQRVYGYYLRRALVTLLAITGALLTIAIGTTIALAVATILAVTAILVAVTTTATVATIIAVTSTIPVTAITTAVATRFVTLLVI